MVIKSEGKRIRFLTERDGSNAVMAWVERPLVILDILAEVSVRYLLAGITRYRVKGNVAITLAGLLGVTGFWLGEGALPARAELPIAVGVIGCLAVAFIVPGKPWLKALCGVASLALYAVAFFVGSLSFSRAFNECVERGEEVRTQLSAYHQRKNQYPERLRQLEGFGLCGRVTRPTVLEYERTSGSYVLSFKDGLVEHTATESEPFTAHK